MLLHISTELSTPEISPHPLLSSTLRHLVESDFTPSKGIKRDKHNALETRGSLQLSTSRNPLTEREEQYQHLIMTFPICLQVELQ